MNTFINKFPVFEAEQVLSQKELNNIISYLENQDRATRITLFGVGIVDGLYLTKNENNHVTISCGTAITSLGYLLQWETKTYTHYHTREIANNFYAANYAEEPFLASTLDYAKQYEVWKNSYELTNVKSLNATLLNDTILNDHIIVLVIEAQLIDQKNCLTTNCDDKGKRLEFNISPRLLPKEFWNTSLIKEAPTKPNLSSIKKKRFNIPHKNISDANGIFSAFKNMYDTSYISTIQENINALINNTKHHFDEPSWIPLETKLGSIKQSILKVLNTNTFEIQYQYISDWIGDIIDAYNEILQLPNFDYYFNCSKVDNFPYHIVLGGFNDELKKYRTPFYKKNSNNNTINLDTHNLLRYLNRLVLIVENFNPAINGLRITPSLIGPYQLSSKSIPCYYNNIITIKEHWTIQGNETFNNPEPLSYHSNVAGYSDNHSIKNPLDYGLDNYNFFRIEGIIGQPYKNALQNLALQKNAYHLPFEIVAVNAANLGDKEISIEHFDGRFEDLEVDYDIARKRVFNIAEFVINWIQKNKASFSDNGILLSAQQIIQLEEMLDEMNSLLTEDLMEFLNNYDDFNEVFLSMNELFLFHKSCIQKVTKAFNLVAEDLVDRMDDINELFLENPFDILHNAANERWKQLYKQYFFTHFYEKNPGLDHQSGVITGGTYVVVYVDNSIFKKKILEGKINIANLLKKINNYKDQFNFNEEEKQSIKKNLLLSKFKLKTKRAILDSNNDCAEQTDKIKEELLLHISENIKENYALNIQGFLIDKIQNAIKFPIGIQPINPNYENLVIADFYLPYICHNTGPQLAIKIEQDKAIHISMDITSFCINDSEEYIINTNNDFSGSFVGNTNNAIKLVNNQWIFMPNRLTISSEPYFIQYKNNNIVSNAIAIDIKQPITINWSVTKINATEYEFKNNGNTELNYEVNFDDTRGFFPLDENSFKRSFTFSAAKNTHKITFRVINSICKEQQVIIIANGDFDTKDFNNNDFLTPKN